ncbi:hypothetical protein VQH23_03950 [Pararoseomonas sp. SCSIO 73927]|uniref:hypothetical protein n=1 Tax=Pararoseomonas sp. SCSIO 73927 TaxID=3114537 RepID=UPI0030CC4825
MIFWVSWSGRGRLVPFFGVAAIVVGLVIAFFARAPGAGLGTLGPWPFSAGFVLVGVLTLPLGVWWNRRSARRITAPSRAQADPGPAPHRFCGLAMQWWSVLMIGFGALLLTDQEPEREPRGAAAVAIEELRKE